MCFLRCGPQLKIRTNKTGLIFQGKPCRLNLPNPQLCGSYSQDHSCTTNNAYPTYEFMLLNVAHLLLSMPKDKSKIKFTGDLCSNNTLMVDLCETFLSNVIIDSEISISNFNIIRCDRHSQRGGGVCIYLKQSFVMTYYLVILIQSWICLLLS